MAPVTAAGVCAQTLAEAMGGMAFVQLVRPGAPVVLGSFASSISMQSGAPTFGTPEPALVLYVMAALARRLGVPFRSGGNLCASKIPDAQAAYESAATFGRPILGGVNFVLHAAGWLEGGLTVGYEKFILDTDQCGMAAVFVKGVDLCENGQALDAILENGPASTSSGAPTRWPTSRPRSTARDRRQQQLRAVAGGRLARRGAAGERDLEADARRVRGAADRPRRRRGAPGVHRQAQGVDAGLGGLGPVLFRRRSTLRRPPARRSRAILAPRRSSSSRSRTPSTRRPSLPAGATVSVTASPAKGIEATVALCEQLQAPGFRAVPHLSARMVRDRAHLADLIAWLEGAGVDRAFVVGGDEKEPGRLPGRAVAAPRDARDRPSAERDRDPVLPARPRVHRRPLAARRAPREGAYASYMTTQLCFDPGAIATWLAARRAEGLLLPVHIGVPGVAEPHKLLAIAARIGVADTHRFLTKNIRFVARLMRSGGFYRPDGLLEGIAPHAADPAARIIEVHLYTFNAVEATERWRRDFLARQGAAVAAA